MDSVHQTIWNSKCKAGESWKLSTSFNIVILSKS